MSKKKRKGIGSFDLFAMGFGAIVGVGWAVALNRWMAHSGGPVPAATGFLLVLIMMVPIALCYAELAPMIPVAGGGMVYAYRAFNEKIAFISGWAAFGAFVTIIPWEAIFVVDLLGILFPAVRGPLLYELAGVGIHLGHIIIGTFFSTILFFINRKGAAGSAALQRVLVFSLVASGLIAMGIALIKFDVQNLQPLYQNVSNAPHSSFLAGAFAIFAMAPFFLAGFETIPQAVEEAKGSGSSIGKTVMLSVGLACLFYAALLVTFGGAMPWTAFYELDTPAAANLFQEVFDGTLGTIMYYMIVLGAITGLFTTWNGFMMASPRLLMGMSRAYLLPNVFAKQHKKYQTPINGLYFCYALSLLGPFLGMGLIDPLTSFSAAGFVLSWTVTAFSVVALRKKEPDAKRLYKMPGGAKLAGVTGLAAGIVFILLFIPGNPAFMGAQAVQLFIGWMLVGGLLYFLGRSARKQVPKKEREAAIYNKN